MGFISVDFNSRGKIKDSGLHCIASFSILLVWTLILVVCSGITAKILLLVIKSAYFDPHDFFELDNPYYSTLLTLILLTAEEYFFRPPCRSLRLLPIIWSAK